MNLNLQDGFILETLVMNDFIHHYGIVVIENDEIFVIHNTFEDSVIVDTFTDFLINRKLIAVHENKVDFDKIKQLKDMKYNLFSFNCIDFVNLVSIW